MKKDTGSKAEASRAVLYDQFEFFARQKVQEFLQDILEEEIGEFLGRANPEIQRPHQKSRGLFASLSVLLGTQCV